MPESNATNWLAIARARSLDIPDEEIARIAPSLDALTRDFAALKPRIPHELEPAVTLSEMAVIAK